MINNLRGLFSKNQGESSPIDKTVDNTKDSVRCILADGWNSVIKNQRDVWRIRIFRALDRDSIREIGLPDVGDLDPDQPYLRTRDVIGKIEGDNPVSHNMEQLFYSSILLWLRLDRVVDPINEAKNKREGKEYNMQNIVGFKPLKDFIIDWLVINISNLKAVEWMISNLDHRGRKDYDVDRLFEIISSKATDYLGRKLIFEHYIDENIDSMKVFNPIEYTTKIDRCFGEFHKCKNLGIREGLRKIQRKTRNKNEIEFVFDTFFTLLGSGRDTEEVLNLSLEILVAFRGELDGLLDPMKRKTKGKIKEKTQGTRIGDFLDLDEEWVQDRGDKLKGIPKLNKAIEFTIINGEEVSVENIKKNLEYVIFYWTLPFSKLGAGAEGWNKFSKDLELHELEIFNRFMGLFNGNNGSPVVEGEKEESQVKKIIKDYITSPISKFFKKKGEQISGLIEKFGEWLLTKTVRHSRKKKNLTSETMTEEDHIELIKRHRWQQQTLDKAGSQILNTKTTVKKRNVNLVMKQLQHNTKKRAMKLLAGKTLAIIYQLFGTKYMVRYLHRARFISQTGIYLVLDLARKELLKTDFMRRGDIIHEARNGYLVEESPEMFYFLARNIARLEEAGDDEIDELSKKFLDLLETEGERLNSSFEDDRLGLNLTSEVKHRE